MPVIPNPFRAATIAGLAKQYSLKVYLMIIRGMSEEQANARLAQVAAVQRGD